MTVLAAEVDHTSSQPLLVVAALLGIAVVVVLITVFKVHPFLALILGSAVLGLVAGVGVSDIVASFTAGVGSTVGNVGLLIALGAMIGGLLTASGGADGWSTGSSTGSAPGRSPGRWAAWPR
jgi:gluconate:H+ symporter, GntP family